MKICITPVKICRTHIKTEHMYCKGIHNSLVNLYKYVLIFKEVSCKRSYASTSPVGKQTMLLGANHVRNLKEKQMPIIKKMSDYQVPTTFFSVRKISSSDSGTELCAFVLIRRLCCSLAARRLCSIALQLLVSEKSDLMMLLLKVQPNLC